MAVVSHKKEPTLESEDVAVGKKNLTDKVFVAFVEEGEDEDKMILALQSKFEMGYKKYTKPFKAGAPKPKAKAGKIVNQNSAWCADEFLHGNNVADIVDDLYPNAVEEGLFDDDKTGSQILGNYFSLISTDEAKYLVLEAIAKTAIETDSLSMRRYPSKSL